MSTYHISGEEVANLAVAGKPSILTGTVIENQSVFDALPKMIVDKHNELCDAVDSMDSSRDAIIRGIYPVGSVAMNTTGINPKEYLLKGSEWSEITGLSFGALIGGTAEVTIHIFIRIS